VRHRTDEYCAFTGSLETRLVFALNSAGEIEYLPENAAPEFKERRKQGETFSCVVPGCGSPALTVVDRGDRRHGFSHVAGGGHDGVGIAHLQCQLLIKRWLTNRYPMLEVDLEVTTLDGRRRADVMATSPATGAQIAFEVQYAQMSPDQWRARHDSYRELGIVDVWLWGYGGDHFHRSKNASDVVVLGPTLSAVADAGAPVLFIDPSFESIGYATERAWDSEPRGQRVLSTVRAGELQSERLDAFRLDNERRFITDELAALLRASVRVKLAAARRQAEREEHVRRKLDVREWFFARVQSKSEAHALAWETSSERHRIVTIFGSVPGYLQHTPASGGSVIQLPLPPAMWQSKLYLNHVYRRRCGQQVSIRKMVQELEAMDRDVRFPEEAVRSWLGELEKHGIVAKRESRYLYDKWPKYEIAAQDIGPVRSLATPQG